jgi:hypothetical protein
MGRRLIVDELIESVRLQLVEANTESVTNEFILDALNRGQDYACNIFARHFDAPLLTYTSVPTVAGQQEYFIPRDALEQRLELIEVNINGVFYPVTELDKRDATLFESQSAISIPYYYVVIGDKYRLIPRASGIYPLRVWYMRDPDPFETSQGMITSVNLANNYLIIDEVGPDLTTESDKLDSYVNLIDGQTGRIKATMQVQTISNGRITFRSTPIRTKVLDKPILSALPLDMDGVSSLVQPDDYICLIHGSCVPFIKKPMSNYVIQYAVAEIRRALGGPAELEEAVKKQMQDEVEHSWVGRPNKLRVKAVSGIWGRPGIRRRVLINSKG